MCNSYLITGIFAVLALFVHIAEAYTAHGIMRIRHQNAKRNEDSADKSQGAQQEMCFTIPHLQSLKEQFTTYIDKNGDSRASNDEIMEYLQKYNPDTKPDQVDNFIARRDHDGDGFVDFIPDYLMEVSSPDYDQNAAKEWFELEDTDSDGYVSRDELVGIAMKIGMPLEEAERTAASYYMSADRNKDGRLSWEEYKQLFLRE